MTFFSDTLMQSKFSNKSEFVELELHLKENHFLFIIRHKIFLLSNLMENFNPYENKVKRAHRGRTTIKIITEIIKKLYKLKISNKMSTGSSGPESNSTHVQQLAYNIRQLIYYLAPIVFFLPSSNSTSSCTLLH